MIPINMTINEFISLLKSTDLYTSYILIDGNQELHINYDQVLGILSPQFRRESGINAHSSGVQSNHVIRLGRRSNRDDLFGTCDPDYYLNRQPSYFNYPFKYIRLIKANIIIKEL